MTPSSPKWKEDGLALALALAQALALPLAAVWRLEGASVGGRRRLGLRRRLGSVAGGRRRLGSGAVRLLRQRQPWERLLQRRLPELL